ncbi:60S ribosomal protein L34 [Tanacetum coccineum]
MANTKPILNIDNQQYEDLDKEKNINRLPVAELFKVDPQNYEGLMEAIKNLLAYAEHWQCARHIYANFKKKWNGLHFKSLFWGVATSTVQNNFYTKLNLIGNIEPEVKQWLVDRNPNWCRAFFKMDRGCAAYENGISESYHNSIRIARSKPLITMLEEIRVYLMQRLYSMHNLATNLVDSITPSIRKEIERLKHSQRYWTVYPCGDNVFEVRKGDDSYGVNIENRTCACKWWDLSDVPCVHSAAAFSFLKNDSILGVSACVANPSSAGPNVVDPSSTGPSEADPSFACPSIADSTGSGTQAAIVTEDPIVADPTDDIPTQQSKTSDTAKIIEDAIVTGRLETAGLKRRCKSKRIAKRAKAFQFGKDGAGSCSEKA